MTDLLQFVASLSPRKGESLEESAARIDRAIVALESAAIAATMTEADLQRIVKAARETA